ncbi:unnamed protein product [Pseudo-nitzschia multistriata]|uniref:Uncharacterized protein n=1 Tax=Pseudo-nitzschia multistriata TaxID=183589 RepID=A0A448Z8Q1_9STRA|nr:unnamed protein product [Pseudo-nitzschia multistriata]
MPLGFHGLVFRFFFLVVVVVVLVFLRVLHLQLVQLVVAAHASHQCLEGVDDEVVQGGLREGLVVLLEVGPGRLAPGPHRRGVEFVHVSRRAGLVEVGRLELRVHAGHQQADPKGPPDVRLGRPLVLVGQVAHDHGGRDGGPVDVLVVEALVPHVLGQGPGVRRQPRDSHADVVVDLEELLLVARQLAHRPLEGPQDDVGAALDAHAGRSLLDGFHGVFDLRRGAVEERAKRNRAKQSMVGAA